MTKLFKWQGRNWECSMEGGRLVHTDAPHQYYDDSQVSIGADDVAELRIKHAPKYIEHWDGKANTYAYATGVLRSVEAFSYGRFSAEIQLPKGGGAWPAFWLTGADNWPPEIDIVEGYANKSGSYLKAWENKWPYISGWYRTETNIHYITANMEHHHVGGDTVRRTVFNKQQPYEKFNNYAVEWRKESIKFYYNDVLVREIFTPYPQMMVNNVLQHPELANPPRMFVVFNYWLQNPADVKVSEPSIPMRIKNVHIEEYR